LSTPVALESSNAGRAAQDSPLHGAPARHWAGTEGWRAGAQTLRRLQACPHVVRLAGEGDQGAHEGRTYLVMELLGANLAQLRVSAPGARFEPALVQGIGARARPRPAPPPEQPATASVRALLAWRALHCPAWCCALPIPAGLRGRAGAGVLEALEGIHRAGFLHRDVKPANFALALGAPGPDAPGAWRALDFGLARRYVGDAGEVPALAALGYSDRLLGEFAWACATSPALPPVLQAVPH
jgi:serine/threonine protein kinase